jgi:hypothetical protein
MAAVGIGRYCCRGRRRSALGRFDPLIHEHPSGGYANKPGILDSWANRRVGWKAEIRTGFLRELSDCSGIAGTAQVAKS